jgi:hypothetical protein
MKHTIVAIDTSLSMRNYIASAVCGLNEFTARLKLSDPDSYISVLWFNDGWNYVVKASPILFTPLFTISEFSCRSTTSLYDFVYWLVNEWIAFQHLTSLYIISDGDDTTSKIHSELDTTTLCKNATDIRNWAITHCSTDTSKLIDHTNQIRYNPDDIENMMAGLGI